MIVLVVYRTILNFTKTSQNNKKAGLELLFSLSVIGLITAFGFFIVCVIMPELYFVFIGEGSSGPSGSSSSGNNPGGG
jgi:hypothetical protein